MTFPWTSLIIEHLTILNILLEGRQIRVTHYSESIRSFRLKLTLWVTQLSGGDLKARSHGGAFGAIPPIFCAPRFHFAQKKLF